MPTPGPRRLFPQVSRVPLPDVPGSTGQRPTIYPGASAFPRSLQCLFLRVCVVPLLALGACGSGSEKAVAVDPVWQGDSALIASRPAMVFRVIEHDLGRAVVPISMLGMHAPQRILLADRGWRALDSTYLLPGKVLLRVRNGEVAGEARVKRRMWESYGPLDTLPGCPRVVPAALADVPAGTHLLIAGKVPTLKPVAEVSSRALSEALATIPTLIAPSKGIPTAMMPRYTRVVHSLATGAGEQSSILVMYTDPSPVSDTLKAMGQRPRQMVVIMDLGNFGYRASYSFTTLGNALAPPRMTFLDHVDVDGDGISELFFGAVRGGKYESTIVLRYGRDQEWREVMNELVRCQI